MTFKLLNEQHLELLSLKGGCTGLSESIHVKMPHCWKSHVVAHMYVYLDLCHYDFFRESIDSRNLLVYDGTVYIITMTAGSEVKVTAADFEGSVLWTKSVMSAWLDKTTK